MQNFDDFDLWAGYGAAEPVRPAAEGVAQLLRRITSALAAGFSSVKVTGEIHSISRAPSGHIYFDLKDAREDAHISCALFRGQLRAWILSLRAATVLWLRAKSTSMRPGGR
ncbi:MAG: exodeoxyribonuclease VII large subunit [Duodenibacillus massiliensis]